MNHVKCELILPSEDFYQNNSAKELYESVCDISQSNGITPCYYTRSRSRMQFMEPEVQQINLDKRAIIRQTNSISINSTPQNESEASNSIPKNQVQWSQIVKQQAKHLQLPLDTGRGREFSQLIVQFHSLNFVKRLLQLLRPDSSFTQVHFDLINDRASTFIVNPLKQKKSITSRTNTQTIDCRVRMRLKVRRIIAELTQCALSVILAIPLIEPNSNLKLFWNSIMCLIRLYLIVWIPIVMSFIMVFDSSYISLLISSLLLILDVIVRCFTIQFDQGLPVKDRYQLAINQASIQTFIEVCATLNLMIVSYTSPNVQNSPIYQDGWPKIFFIFLYPQIKILFELVQNAQESITLSKSSVSLIELFKLVSLILLIQHIFSCLWAILGQYSYSIGMRNWMQDVLSSSSDWNEIYIESLYFISVTMFTVGYGDLNPQSITFSNLDVYEKSFCIIFMFLCTLQLSYSVNTIGIILAQIRQQSEGIRQKIIAINLYMQSKKISQQLQLQVREYFHFYFKQILVQQSFEQTEILGLLPDDLRQSLVIEAASALLGKCPVIQNNFTKEFLDQLLCKVYFSTFQPGMIISSKTLNLDNEQFICIIEQGLVEVYREKQLISTLKQHQSIGLWEFLHQTKSEFTFKSAGFTSVLVIPFNAFQEIMKDRQLDKEHYFNMIDDLQIGQQCLICANNKHQTQQCKLVQYVPDYEKIIKRYLFHQDQEQKPYSRNKCRNKSFFHAYNDKEFIKEAANMYVLEHENEIQEIFPTLKEYEEDPILVKYNTKQIRLNSNDENVIESQSHSNSDQEEIAFPVIPNKLLTNSFHEKPKVFEKRISVFSGYKASEQSMDPKSKSSNRPIIRLPPISHFGQKKAYRSSTHSEIRQSNSQIIKQNNNPYQDLQILFNNIHKYMQREQDQIFEVTKRLDNIYYDPFIVNKITFENLKQYDKYKPAWNVENIIRKYQIFRHQGSIDIRDKYCKYMLLPYQYLWTYRDKNKQTSDDDIISIQKRKKLVLKTDMYENQKQKRNLRRSRARVFPEGTMQFN